MCEEVFLRKLKAALRLQGVWGRRADQLLQEWREHVADDVERRVAQGEDRVEAERAGWRGLGEPEILAVHAAGQYAAGSWMGRHPWLAGLVLPVLVWAFVLAAVFLFGAFGMGFVPECYDPAALDCWSFVFNWLPWLISVAWLAWIARGMPGGWKLLWISALVLSVLSSMALMSIQPALNGPESGRIVVSASGPGRWILVCIWKLLKLGADATDSPSLESKMWWPLFFQWGKALLLGVLPLAVRSIAILRSRSAAVGHFS